MRAPHSGSWPLLFALFACHARPLAPVAPAPPWPELATGSYSTATELAPALLTGPLLPDGCPTTELEAQQAAAYLSTLPDLTPGSINGQDLKRAIERHGQEVRACYWSALATSAHSLSGRVDVRFVIAGDGSVPIALVKQSAPNLQDVACCITQYIRSWTFDVPSGHGVMQVEYPYLLAVDSTATGRWTRVMTPDDPAPPRGSLTVRQQIETEATHQDELSRCYETTLGGARPKLLVALHLQTSPEGHVTSAGANESLSKSLRECVLASARSWRFPVARLASDFWIAVDFPQRPRP